jgi:hypothetical protein
MANQNRLRFRFWSPILSATVQAKAFVRVNRQPYFKFYAGAHVRTSQPHHLVTGLLSKMWILCGIRPTNLTKLV